MSFIFCTVIDITVCDSTVKSMRLLTGLQNVAVCSALLLTLISAIPTPETGTVNGTWQHFIERVWSMVTGGGSFYMLHGDSCVILKILWGLHSFLDAA